MEAKKGSSFKMVQLVNSSRYFKESEEEKNGGSSSDLGSRELLGPVMAGGLCWYSKVLAQEQDLVFS